MQWCICWHLRRPPHRWRIASCVSLDSADNSPCIFRSVLRPGTQHRLIDHSSNSSRPNPQSQPLSRRHPAQLRLCMFFILPFQLHHSSRLSPLLPGPPRDRATPLTFSLQEMVPASMFSPAYSRFSYCGAVRCATLDGVSSLNASLKAEHLGKGEVVTCGDHAMGRPREV